MRIASITVENFGPYYGNNTVEMHTLASSPVVLLHGENMRGKTTLFHAFRWCLYNNVQSHSGEELTAAHFANWDRRDTGEPFDMAVTLVLDDAGELFSLKRWANCVQDRNDPTKVVVTELRSSLLTAQNNAIPTEDIQDRVNEMLNEDFADLFLFDGETLDNYEKKLKSSTAARELVSNSIEKALGLSAFNTIIGDFSAIKLDVEKEFKATLKDEKQAQSILTDLEVIAMDLKAKRKNYDEVNEILGSALTNKEKLQPVMTANAAFGRIEARKDELADEIARLNNEIEENRTRILATLKGQFWIPCVHMLALKLRNLNTQYEEAVSASTTVIKSSVRLEEIRDSLSANHCTLCQQALGESAKHLLEQEIDAVQMGERAQADYQRDLHHLKIARDDLSRFSDASASIELIKDWDSRVQEAEIRRDSKKNELNEVRQQLESVGEDFSDTERRYAQALSQIDQSERALPELQKDIDRLDLDRKNKDTQLKTFSSDSSPLRRKLDVLENLIKIYEHAMGEFRDRMRLEVQDEASRIFRLLTTEPQYAGLRITRNYYLEIVDKEDRIVQRRSAGAEQVVALSLIGALVSCSVREAPVVIDTPLGRLDKGHRKNILEWLHQMGSQVIMFVTSTEFDGNQDRAALGESIGREYDLVRISDRRTEIRRHEHV